MTHQNLWAPWRSQYVGGAREPGCVFCNAAAAPDDPERLVVAVEGEVFALLNRFPYNAGHAMIVPKRHVAAIEELSENETAQLWRLMVRVKAALGELFRPDGFNLGMNLGQAAGAGIAAHLHLHVVPRWVGDTNFMASTDDVRVVSTALGDTHGALRRLLATP
jgi:ATP adenylyltransferase